MKTKSIIFLLGILCPVVTFSQQIYQLSDGGNPWGYHHPQYDANIVYESMPSFDVNALHIEDSLNANDKNRPYRFGYNHFVNLNLNNSGSWLPTSDGGRIWRLGLTSAGALSINLAFQYVSIPAGGKLFIYNKSKTLSLGAFSQAHISHDHNFGTELINDDSIVVEYYEPASAIGMGSLEIFRITHRYRGVDGFLKSFGQAGSCENNARCPAYAAHDNNIRSVVCLVSGGSEFCSGSLINNTCNDGTPYVLTANHCGSSGFGSWVFRFNWEASGCTNPGSSPSTAQSISGGTQRAFSSGSDFSLVQINSAIPASYNVYFSGWDRTTTAATNPYGIHHPSGDIKKFSQSTGTATAVTINFNGNANTMMWQTPTWTDGVTEPGSSGSPLFNSSGQIIGQLGGGPSDCTCENVSSCGYDYYGRLVVSWTGGGTNGTRLSNWLDPAACNTGVTTLPGYDPNASVIPVASFTTSGNTICAGGTVTYTNTSTNATSFSWVFPGGSPASGTTSPITVTYAAAGSYTTTLTAVNGANTSTSTVTITVNALPAAPTVSNTGPYCAGSTIQLNCSVATTYSWTGPNSFTNTTQNPTIASSTTAMSGTYTVQITNAAGCTRTGTTAVVVNANPTANATNGGPYCVGATIQLNSVGGSATDDWTGPGGYSAPNTQNPTRPGATVGMAGVYTVTVTNGSGCTSTSTTTVTVNANPSAPTVSNTGPYCAGSTIQLNCSVATTYSWTGPNSFTNTSQNPTIASSTTAMSGTYTVQITNASGCTNSGTTAVVVNAVPTASATNGGPYCLGATIQLNSIGGSATDDWAGPNSYAQNNVQNPTISGATLAMNGVYTVTLTNGSGCTATATTSVTVINPSSATAGNTGPYCIGSTISLNASGSGLSYAWSGPLAYNSALQNPTISGATLSMGGSYTVVITYSGGCTSSATTSVTVNANPSAPVITPSGNTTFCSGNSITLTSSYSSGNVWSTSETTNSISVNSSGTYMVTVTDVNGCTSTASQVITVNSLPTVTQSSLGTVCLNSGSVILSGGSPAGGSYSGTAVTAGQFNPSVSGVGIFNITYTYTDGNGCTNSAVTPINVLACSGIGNNNETLVNIYPNPTTEILYITGLETGTHDFSIINTLGQQIKTGKLNGDGAIDIGIVASGTYYLKIDNQYWKIIKN